MDRVFLDANVLFSAAYREDAGLRRLWDLPHATLVTSGYAVAEAERNLEPGARQQRLDSLVASLEVVAEPPNPSPLPAEIELPEGDRPILAAAMTSGCTHLLSGDRRAFGAYYGRKVAGVSILRLAESLRGPGKAP